MSWLPLIYVVGVIVCGWLLINDERHALPADRIPASMAALVILAWPVTVITMVWCLVEEWIFHDER